MVFVILYYQIYKLNMEKLKISNNHRLNMELFILQLPNELPVLLKLLLQSVRLWFSLNGFFILRGLCGENTVALAFSIIF